MLKLQQRTVSREGQGCQRQARNGRGHVGLRLYQQQWRRRRRPREERFHVGDVGAADGGRRGRRHCRVALCGHVPRGRGQQRRRVGRGGGGRRGRLRRRLSGADRRHLCGGGFRRHFQVCPTTCSQSPFVHSLALFCSTFSHFLIFRVKEET